MHVDHRLLKNFTPAEKVKKIESFVQLHASQWTPAEIAITKLLLYGFCDQQYEYKALLKCSMVDLNALYLMKGHALSTRELRKLLDEKSASIKAIWFDLSSMLKVPIQPIAFNEYLTNIQRALPIIYNNWQFIIQQQQ